MFLLKEEVKMVQDLLNIFGGNIQQSQDKSGFSFRESFQAHAVASRASASVTLTQQQALCLFLVRAEKSR